MERKNNRKVMKKLWRTHTKRNEGDGYRGSQRQRWFLWHTGYLPMSILCETLTFYVSSKNIFFPTSYCHPMCCSVLFASVLCGSLLLRSALFYFALKFPSLLFASIPLILCTSERVRARTLYICAHCPCPYNLLAKQLIHLRAEDAAQNKTNWLFII